jgi:hypothetical protein
MAISRSSQCAVHRAGRWMGWLLVLGLTACGVAEQGAANQAPTAASRASAATPQESTETPETTGNTRPLGTPDTRTIQRATPAATTTTVAATAWQTYHSVAGRYTVEYPATWTVNEQTGAAGAVATTFTPSGGGAGVVITVRPTDPAQQEPLDLPNTRCQPVPGNRGIATRCLDTIARTSATTFVGQDRTYMITIAGKGMDEHIYQHMLNSFAPDAPAAAGRTQTAHRPQNDLAPLLLQPGDLPDNIASEPADDPAPPNFADDPPATTMVGRRLTRDGRAAGSVSLLFYNSPSDLAQAYQRLTASTDPFAGQGNAMEPRTDVGEKAVTARLTLASSTYGPTHTVVVIFARCHALIDMQLNEQADLTLETAVAYAKRLDERIAAALCQ